MNIYIGNLNASTNESHLRDLFMSFGTILSVRLMMDHGTGQSKCFGFIEMGRQEGVEAIRKLNNFNFMSYYLEVSEARPNSTARPGSDFSYRLAAPQRPLQKKKDI